MTINRLAAAIRSAVLSARDNGDIILADESFPVKLEMPPSKQFGDYSCNIALTLKKLTDVKDSRQLAAIIRNRLGDADGLIERTEIAGHGFINLYLHPEWLHNTLHRIEEEGERYGTSSARKGEKVLIEFVSANPTGPISVVNGRAAALGDALANLLASQGSSVSREFYVNDALNSLQLELFSKTVQIRYLQQLGHPVRMPDDTLEPGVNSEKELPVVQFPQNGYLGEYVREIAKEIVTHTGEKFHRRLIEANQSDLAEAELFFRDYTLESILTSQRNALEAFGVNFDKFFFESSLYESGEVDDVISALNERGCTYERDGALWLKSSEFGDDEDRVLVRSNEKATYIAADAAYHKNKYSRGFNHLIDIFGADHHGYIARLKASISALGYQVESLDVILTQMISLLRDGEAVIGGKRKGTVIELKEDLIDDIGRDAARFYFLLNSYDTPATVDVELARRQSNENPVYYVQYAHARLCSILRRSAEQGATIKPSSEADLSLLIHTREQDVLRKLNDYPAELANAAERYAPHRLTRYAIDLSGLLNLFYENCRVLSGTEETVPPELTTARLCLVNGSRITLRNLLSILGISAPERMDRSGD